MPSNDAPFMIESDDELPAISGKKRGDEITRDTVRVGEGYERLKGSHVDSIHKVPKLH
jgi:hypothetical protein